MERSGEGPSTADAHAAHGKDGERQSVSIDPAAQALQGRIAAAIAGAGGWIPFERFMGMALTEPGLGYYARGAVTFGQRPQDGSDFVTAPELSPHFGRALARQVAEAFALGAPPVVTEFGPGSGALAAAVIPALAGSVRGRLEYRLVEVSAPLRERQRERLMPLVGRCAAAGVTLDLRWLDALPPALDGVVLANEVLDALPVALLRWDGERWLERGVALQDPGAVGAGPAFRFEDRPGELRPPVAGGFVPGTVVELARQGPAWAATVAERLHRGLALLIDYGFPEAEFFHPQRTGGTLMCHRAHRADTDPLADVGLKDITAHVDFTAVALAAQQAGAEVLGYTSQGRFLLNAGITDDLQAADVRERVAAHRLIAEHEMGELFKVLAFGRGLDWGLPPARGVPLGFAQGDRLHRL